MDSEGYTELWNALCQVDPRLRAKWNTTLPQSSWHPWKLAAPKVIALGLQRDGRFGSTTEYDNPDILRNYLRKSNDGKGQRSVYILESLCPKFARVLGLHFQLHPGLFIDHDRLFPFRGRVTGEGGGITFLPSAIVGREYCSFKYHEPLLLSQLPTDFRNLCNVSGRHIAITRTAGKFSDVGIVRRKCLIVCDPPIKRILTDYSGKSGYDVTTSPYSHGYSDFMPQKDQLRSLSGPPRTCFLDDLVFYLQTHAQTLELAEPDSLRLFTEKIVASHYLKLTEFLSTLIEKVQFGFSRRQDLSSFAITAVEEQWSDVQALERRISEFKDDLEAIMLQLRIPFDNPTLYHSSKWTDTKVDFQFLYSRFCEISQRANNLNNSATALASLTNSRHAFRAQDLALEAAERSLNEARSVKTLTKLGLVFIPLAYVAALFSMSGPFRPGGDLFWVYFVVSLPLIGFVIFGYQVMDLGYVEGRMKWSLGTLLFALATKGRSWFAEFQDLFSAGKQLP